MKHPGAISVEKYFLLRIHLTRGGPPSPGLRANRGIPLMQAARFWLQLFCTFRFPGPSLCAFVPGSEAEGTV